MGRQGALRVADAVRFVVGMSVGYPVVVVDVFELDGRWFGWFVERDSEDEHAVAFMRPLDFVGLGDCDV